MLSEYDVRAPKAARRIWDRDVSNYCNWVPLSELVVELSELDKFQLITLSKLLLRDEVMQEVSNAYSRLM